MLGYSKIQIMGNCGGVPEVRFMPSGESVVNFSVAVNRRYKDRDGVQKSATEWFRICAFNQLGDNCARFLTRGSPVFVEGRLQVRQFESKNGGSQVSVEIIPSTMRFLGSAPGPAEDPAKPGQPAPSVEAGQGQYDDVPF